MAEGGRFPPDAVQYIRPWSSTDGSTVHDPMWTLVFSPVTVVTTDLDLVAKTRPGEYRSNDWL